MSIRGREDSCDGRKPTRFTRVSKGMEWIKEIAGEDVLCGAGDKLPTTTGMTTASGTMVTTSTATTTTSKAAATSSSITSSTPTTTTTDDDDLCSVCGLSNDGEEEEHNRIAGGTAASPNEFPWTAAVVLDAGSGTLNFLCGGTVVGKRWVLTLGQCARPGLSVVVGVHDLEDDKNNQEYKVKICFVPIEKTGKLRCRKIASPLYVAGGRKFVQHDFPCIFRVRFNS